MAKRILVGNEYKQEFESICALIEGDCFGNLYNVRGGAILDGAYEYVLSDEVSKSKEEVKFTFDDDGATWFKALRGEKTENDNVIWSSFIDKIRIEYHKRFSVLEYKKQARTAEERKNADALAGKIARDFWNIFYATDGAVNEVSVHPSSLEEETEDIYGVSMKLELSGGTGESVPILGKVYFSKTKDNMHPILSADAIAIDENLRKVIPDEDDSESVKQQKLTGEALEKQKELRSRIIDAGLNAMEELVTSNKLNFGDYLCCSDEEDKKAIDNLLDQLAHGVMDLECQSVDILYITHVETNAFSYNVTVAGRDMFTLSFGMNNSATINCINCKDAEPLVNMNEIVYMDGEVRRSVVADINEPNWGIDELVIQKIRENSELSNHCVKVSCRNNPRVNNCEVFKCKKQLFEVEVGDRKVYKCLDCSSPEVVYITTKGERKYTPSLYFAKDEMDLVEEAETCKLCGRSFAKLGNQKLCPVCTSARRASESDKSDEKNKVYVENYKHYKTLLPISTRLLSLFSTKYCFEDDEIVLFVIGKNKYLFNKLNVKEYGSIDKPRRVYGD